MQISNLILNSLAFVGLFASAAILTKVAAAIVFYLKFKTFPKTLEEERISILMQEREIHLQKMLHLEEEISDMTKTVLNRLTS